MTRRPRRAGRRAEPSSPSPWRLQHGDVAPPAPGSDLEGRPVVHRRAVDTLGALLANGTVSGAMHDAGQAFHTLFRTAALDPLRPAPLTRLPAGTGATPTERALDARRRVITALDALGGADSAAGSCMWHVVGCGCSIREWATRRGWGGRPVGHAQAQGILVAALGVLAGHLGLHGR